MDFKKIKTDSVAVTRNTNKLMEPTGNIYESVAVMSKRANQIALEIKEDVITVRAGEEVKKEYTRVRIKLDPSVNPRILDVTVVGGAQKDSVLEGIYQLKDEELTICAKVLGKDRPTKFESPAGESVVLIVLKKQR